MFFKPEISGRMLPVLALFLCLLAACGPASDVSKPADTPQANAETAAGGKTELIVSAAASLTDAMKDIQSRYEAKHRVKLVFNFGASGTLQQQIEQGAPADLFISASPKNMKALVDRQLVEASQQTNLLSNELVVVTPADNGAAPGQLKDLADAKVRNIAMGIPESVPAGSYAKEALIKSGLWNSLQGKMVQAKDVRQVLTYVETGNADAGFVYKTDAASSKKAKVAFALQPGTYAPIEYPVGIVKAAKHPKEAQELYDYLLSKEAQDVFAGYGFSLPQ